MKKFLLAIMAAVMVSGLSAGMVSAASSHVVFVGGAEDFVFYNDDDGDSDLFNGLKDVMAGDEKTETITIQNSANDYDYVKIYLQSVTIPDGPANPEGSVTNAEFLANFTLDIRHGNDVIYNGTAQNLDDSVSNVDLGTYYPGDKSVVTIALKAPASLTNRFAHCSSAVNWTFMAEAYKNGEVVPYSPDTGFATGNNAAVAVASVAGVVIVGCVIYGLVRIKNKRN